MTGAWKHVHLGMMLAILAIVGLPRGARAEHVERAAVGVSGKASVKTLNQIESVSAQHLRSVGWSLIDRATSGIDASALSACVLARKVDCVAGLTGGLGVERVLLVIADPERSKDGVDAVVLTAWFLATSDGKVQAVNRRYCEQCSVPQMDEAVTVLVDSLVKDLRSKQAYGVVRVKSNPPGALVSIDGKAVGKASTGMEFGVSLGPHNVVLELDGHQPVTRIITIVEDKAQMDLDLKLEPDKPSKGSSGLGSGGSDDQSRASSPTKWIVGGGGLLLAAGGVFVLVSDGSDTSGGKRVPDRSDTSLMGASMIAVGAVALGVSGYLFYRDSRRPATRLAVAIDGGGVWLGLAGSF